MGIPIKEWKWYGLPGHLCVSNRCRFSMHTVIGKYKISTVGAYYQTDEAMKMTDIGSNREYETMVFIGDSFEEIDMGGVSLKDDAKDDPYKADELAEKMHMQFCHKYAKEQK